MNCQRIEKWISDSLDGELAERKKNRLEDHLRKCSSCRSYKSKMTKIHELSQSLPWPEKSPVYWQGFSLRLRKKLSALEPERKRVHRWRWAYLAAGTAVLTLVIGSLFFIQKLSQKPPVEEFYIFSFEEAMADISLEIGNDVELEDLLNSIILEDINALVRETTGPYNDYFFLEFLTEEEIEFLESAIKKEMKS